MKKIWPLICVAVIALSAGADANAAMFQDRERHPRVSPGGRDRDRPPSHPGGDSGGNAGGNSGGYSGGSRPAPNWGQENRRDDRINRAMDIGRSRGRVLDAGQQSGSIFWVRVATDRGRVDLLVDVNSGRVIGER